LNAWRPDACAAHAKAQRRPEQADKTIREMSAAEPPQPVPDVGPSDGFRSMTAAVSKTGTLRPGNNRYPVPATAVGRPVDANADAGRIVIRQDGVVVAEHRHHQPRLRRMALALRRRRDDHALTDRPTHRCEIVETGNESRRFENRVRTRSGPDPPPHPDRSAGSDPDPDRTQRLKIGRRSRVRSARRLISMPNVARPTGARKTVRRAFSDPPRLPALRCERTLTSFMGFVFLVSALDWLR
jgi:hypothetical protein